MKKILLLVWLGSMAMLTQAQSSDNATPYLTKSFANQSIADVVCETSGGSIEVAGGSPAEAHVDMYVQSNNGWNNKLSTEEIRQRIEADYDITISLDGTKLSATARPKHRDMDWKHALSISFKIFTPDHVSTELSTSGGSIHLKNLSGTEDFRTSGGSLHVMEVTGKITGTTSGGSIHVSDSQRYYRPVHQWRQYRCGKLPGPNQTQHVGWVPQLEQSARHDHRQYQRRRNPRQRHRRRARSPYLGRQRQPLQPYL